jgi:hypothetical protein
LPITHLAPFLYNWFIFTDMAEISHPEACNFSSPPLFKLVDSFEELPRRSQLIGDPKGSGGGYAVSQIFGARDSADGAAGLFAGAG